LYRQEGREGQEAHDHVHHAKDVVERLARIVAEDLIPSVIVAGGELIIPLLTDQFPPGPFWA
jgi:hypothetical protein